MALLRRKSDKPSRGNHGEAGAEENGRLVTHRVTIGLSRAEKLAAMLASSRAAKTIEVADLLGGMYLYDWERLSKFWNEEHARCRGKPSAQSLPNQPAALALLDGALRFAKAVGRPVEFLARSATPRAGAKKRTCDRKAAAKVACASRCLRTG